MAKRVVQGTSEVRKLQGEHLGYSEWFQVDQARVNAFADATLDHQWIHVDPERAKKESPFGGPIVHGYLTLSLVPHLYGEVFEVQGTKMTINYGLNRVRFPSPVPVGSRVRLGLLAKEIEEVKGGVQCVFETTLEIEGAEKPAMVAEVVFRYYD